MITTMAPCPPHKDLQAYSRGQLSGEASDELILHLSSCDSCQSHLETVNDSEDSLIASLRGMDQSDEYAGEAGYPVAMAQALAALAHANSSPPADLAMDLPEHIGEYRIVRPLGRGGMGNVYLARHTKLDRQVALKVLAAHRLGNRRIRERFEVEMQAVGRLSHPNIVTAHDAREIDGTAVLITEFIDGFDLAQLLARLGPLRTDQACEIIRQVALALEYTSRQGFVHRDVKPSNVMLSSDGEVKLLDLGLARIQFAEDGRHEMTGTGEAMGTADYMAPEQVSDSRSVDVRADIYSLGCTLFKLLTGVAPFAQDETAFAKMTAHVSKKPPSVANLCPNVPSRLVKLVETMLAKDVEQRPQSPKEVATTLREIIGANRAQDLQTSLAELVATARAADPQTSTALPRTVEAKAHSSPTRQRWIPFGVLIATGLAAFLGGVFLGIFITVNYPDGSVVKLMLPPGSRLEIAVNEEGRGAGATTTGLKDDDAGSLPNDKKDDNPAVVEPDFVHFKLKYVTSLWMRLQLLEFYQDEMRDESEASNPKKMHIIDDGESTLVVRNASAKQLATIRRLLAIYDVPEKTPPRITPWRPKNEAGQPDAESEPGEPLRESDSLESKEPKAELDDTAELLRSMQGTWQAVSITDPASTGDRTAGEPPLHFSFKGNEYRILAGDDNQEAGTFSLQRVGKLLQIDLRQGFDATDKPARLGIMRAKDRHGPLNQFELQFRNGADRPTEFDQTNNSIILLQRVQAHGTHDLVPRHHDNRHVDSTERTPSPSAREE